MSLIGLLFSFGGRIGRARFWIGFVLAKALVLLLIATAVVLHSKQSVYADYVPYLMVIYEWVIAAITTTRLRDAGYTGWLTPLFMAIPIMVLVAGVMPPMREANR